MTGSRNTRSPARCARIGTEPEAVGDAGRRKRKWSVDLQPTRPESDSAYGLDLKICRIESDLVAMKISRNRKE